MTEQRATILSKITPLTEKIFLAGLTIGLILTYFKTDSKTIIQVSLLGLAITYFLITFIIINIPRQEDEPFEFKDLLAYSIAPKMMWISSGVSLYGLFIYTLQLGHYGHIQAFRVGGLSIAIGLIIIVYAFFTGTKHLKYVIPTLIRAVPLLIVDFYFLYN